MKDSELQIKLHLKNDGNIFTENSYHSQQYIQKIRNFRTHKIYSKQLILYLSKIIQNDSILTLKKLCQIFRQATKTIRKYITQQNRITQKNREMRKKYRSIFGQLYLAVTHKLNILKYYYGYKQIKESLRQLFKDCFDFSDAFQYLFVSSGVKIQVLHISSQSNGMQHNYLTQKDLLIINYLQSKIQKSTKIICIYQQEHLQIMKFVEKHHPFYPQYQYKQFFKDIELAYEHYQSKFKLVQISTNRILSILPGVVDCITCAQFFYKNMDVKNNARNLCDIIPIERVDYLKSALHRNSIKINILSLINADAPSVLLFGCDVEGLNLIIKGDYLTQTQKDIWEQKFIQLTKSIKPSITINQDYRIQYVPVKEYPFNNLNSNLQPKFLKSIFVMRVKFHPRRPWILHRCQIDQVSYFYRRFKQRNLQLKNQQFYLQLRRRYIKYCPTYPIDKQLQKCQKEDDSEKSKQLLSLVSGKRQIPASSHLGPCKKPVIGEVGFRSDELKEYIVFQPNKSKN